MDECDGDVDPVGDRAAIHRPLKGLRPNSASARPASLRALPLAGLTPAARPSNGSEPS
jgi:hypothetical protein